METFLYGLKGYFLLRISSNVLSPYGKEEPVMILVLPERGNTTVLESSVLSSKDLFEMP